VTAPRWRARPISRVFPDPGPVRVAVLSGEYLDPQRGREVDGRTIRTLWGELAYQLGGWEAYDALLVDGEEGTPPGGERLARLLAHGPTLVLLDEVLVYILKGRAIARGDSNAGQQALIFMQNLTEAVNQQREAAMAYSLQASVGEAVQEEGLLQTLEHIIARIDARREPVSGDEVLKVVQRRLFESTGEPDVAREVARAYAGLVECELLAGAETNDERREAVDAAQRLGRRIEDSYPFHPELIDLMYYAVTHAITSSTHATVSTSGGGGWRTTMTVSPRSRAASSLARVWSPPLSLVTTRSMSWSSMSASSPWSV
jgi:predicted AAA+ superfamily ATPase